jgi:hypothetical protein
MRFYDTETNEPVEVYHLANGTTTVIGIGGSEISLRDVEIRFNTNQMSITGC